METYQIWRNVVTCIVVMLLSLFLTQGVFAKESNKQKAINYCLNAGFQAKKCGDCGKKNSKNCQCCYKMKPFWCPKGLAKAPITYGLYKACIEGKKLEAIKRDVSKVGNTVKLINPKSLTKAYDAYFAVIASGKIGKKKRISKENIRKLQPFYHADLSKVRMAETRILKKGVAKTNCKTIWWPQGSGMADHPEDDTFWFAHELQHYEQCMNKGGRRNFATMWFREVGESYIKLLLNGKPHDINTPGGMIFDGVHGAMDMEQDADKKGNLVKGKFGDTLASSSP